MEDMDWKCLKWSLEKTEKTDNSTKLKPNKTCEKKNVEKYKNSKKEDR